MNIKKLYVVDPDLKGLEAHKANVFFPEKEIIEYVHGKSEETKLSFSIDGICMAQCFHFMEIEKTKKEFLRILKPQGNVFILGRFLIPANSTTKEYINFTRFGKQMNGIKENIQAYGNILKLFGYDIPKKSICIEEEKISLERLL